MERWQNKVAVVTGASAGIGAACVRALLANGMIVVGLARRHAYMENEFRANLPPDQRSKFYALRCDLCIEDDIRNAFAWVAEHLGGVHVLVNNAGIIQNTVQIVSDNNTAALRACLDVNLVGVALCTREAFQLMKRLGIDGHIVFINSISGRRVYSIPGLNWNIYPATKHAITAMTEVLRQEFLQHQTKIKITNVSPGVCDTKIVGDFSTLPTEFPLLQSEDVADAVVYCIQTPQKVQIREIIIDAFGSQF